MFLISIGIGCVSGHDATFLRGLTSALPLANVETKGTAAMAKSPYDTDLDRNPANYQPLTPLGFLERAAAVFPDHTAIIHGPLRRTYAEFYARARRLASALAKRGIKRGDTVSVLLANTPAMLECHYGVPMTQGRAQYAQHPARRADHRLLARPWRSQSGDHRPRIFQGDERSALALQGEAAGDRL